MSVLPSFSFTQFVNSLQSVSDKILTVVGLDSVGNLFKTPYNRPPVLNAVPVEYDLNHYFTVAGVLHRGRGVGVAPIPAKGYYEVQIQVIRTDTGVFDVNYSDIPNLNISFVNNVFTINNPIGLCEGQVVLAYDSVTTSTVKVQFNGVSNTIFAESFANDVIGARALATLNLKFIP